MCDFLNREGRVILRTAGHSVKNTITVRICYSFACLIMSLLCLLKQKLAHIIITSRSYVCFSLNLGWEYLPILVGKHHEICKHKQLELHSRFTISSWQEIFYYILF